MFGKIKSIKAKLGKWFWVIVIVLVVFLIGYFIKSKSGKSQNVTATVQRGEIKEELVLSGSVKADKHVVLYFPTGGKIIGVYVKEGEWVKKGRVLTSLDKTVLNTIYQQTLNTYRSYQAAAESAVDSVKGHSADESYAQKSTRTTAEAARDSAYDAVRSAEYNLNNAALFAPFDGLVASLPFPNPGVNVNITDAQVELLDPSSIYFEVEADQSEVIDIKDKQTVEIVFDSYRDKTLSGTVSFIGYTPKANEVGTIYKVKVSLVTDSLKDTLPRIGMSGDAKFVLSKREDALFVPTRFVNSDKDGKYVNLGKSNKKVRVETGIEGEDNIEIVSGVKEGDVLYD
jgi:membrane fusion protein (multidrug efflux system)